MSDERASHAIDRIEQALARIEAVSTSALARREEFAELKQRHQSLRGRIEGAIAEIDRMLEAEGA